MTALAAVTVAVHAEAESSPIALPPRDGASPAAVAAWFRSVRHRADEEHAASRRVAITESLARVRMAMEGLTVTPDGRILGDPERTARAVGILTREAKRTDRRLTDIDQRHTAVVAGLLVDRFHRLTPDAAQA